VAPLSLLLVKLLLGADAVVVAGAAAYLPTNAELLVSLSLSLTLLVLKILSHMIQVKGACLTPVPGIWDHWCATGLSTRAAVAGQAQISVLQLTKSIWSKGGRVTADIAAAGAAAYLLLSLSIPFIRPHTVVTVEALLFCRVGGRNGSVAVVGGRGGLGSCFRCLLPPILILLEQLPRCMWLCNQVR
jgi:hypothetical protein